QFKNNNIDLYHTVYAGSYGKGFYLKHCTNLKLPFQENQKKIIFIDDLGINLEDILTYYPEATVYKFDKQAQKLKTRNTVFISTIALFMIGYSIHKFFSS